MLFDAASIWDYVLLGWLMIDLIATAFDIWIRVRHEKWETEVVPKVDVALLQHFLEHDYEVVAETKTDWIVRKFR